MSEEKKKGKPKPTQKSIQAQVEGELKEARLKTLKNEVKEQQGKVIKAEQLLETERAALQAIYDKNMDLFA